MRLHSPIEPGVVRMQLLLDALAALISCFLADNGAS
jgi:hypothetical protein